MNYRLLLVALVAIAVTLFIGKAWPHDAPSGWSYPYACCSGIDCRPVSSAWVKSTPRGWQLPTGETVGYRDSRIKPSPDGEFHWCSTAGSDQGRTICLFVPPQSF